MTSHKIHDLSNRIDRQKQKNNIKPKRSTGLGLGAKIATDLVAGVIIGIIIGVYLDKWLESKPLFLIICLLFGIMAAVKNINLTLKHNNAP